MEQWFTIEKIDDETFAISEYGHWEKMHSYLIVGNEKALLIDTGLGIGNIKKEVEKLTNLPIIVLTTHFHWDHIGDHKRFDEIYINELEKDWCLEKFPVPEKIVKNNLEPKNFSKKPPEEFDLEEYKIFKSDKVKYIKDDQIINIGNREIRAMHTPGHSPGHMCFFEEERGYLFTGDLIYSGTLYAFYPTTDPIKFKNSVEKISKIKGIKKILPAHNELKINIDIIDEILKAFEKIESENRLEQGNGIFQFSNFKIHI
ncbi:MULTISPECIES: MBL fold metallo-hydrolase [Oceanotoga]|jgi:glyoxylase-like metal-dependent hydrolase (beta-lactamase superfamily II)|uniref:Glyoxylase-like metal-dependent hydrolase (Beta-lactamase superfamily II) n=1 Tax=Oceanotoga teriensis TaxID=515440 RepID=A0AA45C687_9BACT|nr:MULTISPECIES: MBL fold metallo-hydrolase [Oceanotoga]MDN5343478.1 hypothetical protein [Oceanotoga sp.]MDO7977534.1 MBL fold metallo-hydrolase [Oceanotoga teriensis]PWJ91246.1 glyoxylase-like metal-dependent hydrolase (beta-lactamase superfamily II) [Oceanotoga teriensis]